MSIEQDYYATLELNRSASQEQIERAYQRLSKLHDPKTSRKPRAAQRYAAIQEAYETLSDRRARGAYDRKRARGIGTPGSVAPAEILSNRLVMFGAIGVVAAVAVALALILILGGGGGSPTAVISTGTPTPVPAPQTPPAVQGQNQTLADGLQIITLKDGTGDSSPQAGDTVTVNYTGWVQGGTKFDSSIDRGTPAQFVLGQVISGWDEALQMMKSGQSVRLIIPPELGYGAAGEPRANIPPNATLIFDVDLISFIKGTPTPTPAPTAAATAVPTPAATAAPTAASTNSP